MYIYVYRVNPLRVNPRRGHRKLICVFPFWFQIGGTQGLSCVCACVPVSPLYYKPAVYVSPRSNRLSKPSSAGPPAAKAIAN